MEFLSVQDLAERLGVHEDTIRREIHAGRLEAIRVGRQFRVRADAFDLPRDPRPRRVESE